MKTEPKVIWDGMVSIILIPNYPPHEKRCRVILNGDTRLIVEHLENDAMGETKWVRTYEDFREAAIAHAVKSLL